MQPGLGAQTDAVQVLAYQVHCWQPVPAADHRGAAVGGHRAARSEPPGRLARDGAGELPADNEDGPAQWTLDTLARAARDAGITVGRSQVRRILLAEKVRWRHTRSRAVGTGPEFAPKGPRSWSCTPPRRKAPR